MLNASPNPAHRALAALADQIQDLVLVTQNVDDLHERAGSRGVIHLHGEINRPRCQDCSREMGLPAPSPEVSRDGQRLAPPRCQHCGGRIRPGVVWFGEPLPSEAWALAERAVSQCSVLLLIGTSGLVYPAAALPNLAHRQGAPIVQVNPHPTEFDALATLNLRGRAGDVLPQLLQSLDPSRSA